MADPVSWMLIEPGWNVVAADGTDVGHVDAVTGDENADIFNGLAIAAGPFARPRYVPAEAVARIVEGRVELALSAAAVEQLGEYDEPPESAQVLPDRASATERAEEFLVGSPSEEHRTTALGRFVHWWQSLFRGRG
jgi:hypothetical protein